VAAAQAGGAPDVELRLYVGGYHEPHNDLEADEVLADVGAWLARH
jgi:alpha-beta hydrolase superfamily lysophospholipase